MSEISTTRMVADLEKINNSRITHGEKHTQFQAIVLDPFEGDICNFLLSCDNINAAELVKIMSLLHDFDQGTRSFCQSSKLPDVLQKVKTFSEVSSKLSMLLLEWFKKGCDETTVPNISKANILSIGQFAANCVPLEDLEVSNAACLLLEHLMKYHYVVLCPALYGFSQRYVSNSTFYLRFITIFSRISAYDEDQFKACEVTGALRDLVQLCMSKDVLLQMNALELLTDIANTQSGLDFLCVQQVITWLITVACGAEGSAPDPLLGSQAMRVLGAVFVKASNRSFDFVGKVDSAAIHHFLNTLQQYFEERDETNRICGLAIISDFATVSYTTLNLVMTHNKGRLVQEWLDLLNAAKPELISAVLHSVARVVYQEESHYVQNNTATFSVFRSPGALDATADAKSGNSESKADSDALTAQVTVLKKQLVNGITQAKSLHFVNYLLKTARLPVPSVHHAALDLLTALAAQPTGWGLLALTQAPQTEGSDFATYITNHETEHSREGREWKYSLIKAIAQNPARHHLPDSFVAKIDLMVKQGPHYKPAAMADMQTI